MTPHSKLRTQMEQRGFILFHLDYDSELTTFVYIRKSQFDYRTVLHYSVIDSRKTPYPIVLHSMDIIKSSIGPRTRVWEEPDELVATIRLK